MINYTVSRGFLETQKLLLMGQLNEVNSLLSQGQPTGTKNVTANRGRPRNSSTRSHRKKTGADSIAQTETSGAAPAPIAEKRVIPPEQLEKLQANAKKARATAARKRRERAKVAASGGATKQAQAGG